MLRYLTMTILGYRLTTEAGPWRFREPVWCRLTSRGWRYLPRVRGGIVTGELLDSAYTPSHIQPTEGRDHDQPQT